MEDFEDRHDQLLAQHDAPIAGLALHGIAAAPRSNWMFLRLTLADGRTGWGECTLRAHHAVMQQVVQALAPGLVGTGPHALRALRRALPGLPSGRAGNAVLSALDQACMDLTGQLAGQPIARLYGADGAAPLPSYATVQRSIRRRDPAGFAEGCAAAVNAGFGGVKVMPFDSVLPATVHTPAGRAEVATALARMAAVREAIGPTVPLMVDCHWRLDELAARDFISAAAALDVRWVECPVPESAGWLDTIKRLRSHANALGVQLAGAENAVGLAGVLPFLQAGCYDVVMPDIKYCGGYAELRAVQQQAARAGAVVSPHNPSGPIAHAHTVHLCSAFAVQGPVEQQFAESPLFDTAAVGEMPLFAGGSFTAAGRPGLGVAFDIRLEAAHPMTDAALAMQDPSFA